MINDRLEQVRSQITQAEINYHRKPGSVVLLAVSKTKPVEDIAAAYRAGQRHFGENYCQEALQKQQALGAFNITWHFIGPIQSNKTKALAAHFDWVHSVDSFKIAQRLSAQRLDSQQPLNICLQVNISEESSKAGISLDELPDLCAQIAELPRLKLRGVMAIPSPEQEFERQRLPYRRLYKAVGQLACPQLDTFSMGMSDDLEAAIAEGSTLVRVGTALFGARSYG
ncbi:MAG: YggS family pyridoxal phosphate-dependent enzyme [Methylococcaceae bacterium]|nr:YggS family pyridoxal phosphate-dependent enzyme [Methylococcaceae bacterium]MDZ4157471.1 YggS family pyridoxal phosphate-dependent enzyme [Methylococcales bacterium]MDP2393199.1 YggS family pyridoxal phosphate-dependent enzyme [Methylococcaceae bacterium]MDP3019607.1 YggS family pyridoxal phosphate-dependent enzyme [Methylococcaceae bacterium]MDP3388985.1 YggS family pyridoxal phosphate-dependent enzyme [Methylococcaceae bacterium]